MTKLATLHKTTFEDRAILHLTGADTRQLLQGLITQNMDKVSVATAAYGCLLTPQGKFLVDFFLVQIGEDILLDCPKSLAALLFQKLRLYKLRANVKITDISDDWTTGMIWGDVQYGPAGQMMGLGSGSSLAVAYNDPRLPALGLRLLAPNRDIVQALNHFDCPAVNPANFEAHRLALGLPNSGPLASGADMISEKTFPLDCNLDQLNGLDYAKGCFVGQEVASRMKRKGEIRKRLWQASFNGPAPAPGTDIHADEKTLGTTASGGGGMVLVHLRLDRFAKAGSPKNVTAGETTLQLSRPAYLKD